MPTSVFNQTINEGQSVQAYTTILWRGLSTPEIFRYYTTAGSAASGSDFASQDGTFTLTTNQRSGNVPIVRTTNDSVYEGPETFSYTIAGNLDISNKYIYNVTITDEEDRPRLSIASQTVIEGDSGEKVLAISITASNPAAFNYDITVRTTAGSALEGLDFQPLPLDTVIRMNAGSTIATASVRILGNQWKESTETFTVTVDSSLSSPATATITILDDDLAAVANVISEVLGTSQTKVENEFIQSAAAAALGAGAGAFELYGPHLIELGEGIGSPFSHYYDEVARGASKFSVYAGAFETVGDKVGRAAVALSVVEAVNIAINDVSRNGEPGHVTSEASARLAAAMLSGAIGEWVGAGVTTMMLPMLATGGALAGAPVIVPLLVGVAVGSIVAYGYNQVFDQIAVAGVESLYKTAANPAGIVSSQGEVGALGLGNAVPKAAWRYDSTTKEVTWLNESTRDAYTNALKFVGFDDSGVLIDGASARYAGVQSFIGTDGPDTIIGSSRNDFLLGKDGDDVIWANNGGKNLVDGGGGNDKIYGGASRDIIFGGDGNDILDGGAGNDRLEGGLGSDVIIDWSGDDEILGGAGDDEIRLGKGNRSIDGGEGVDVLAWSQAGSFSNEPLGTGLSLSLISGIATINFGSEVFTQVISGIENVEGLFFYANVLEGNNGSNELSGGIDSDRLKGLGGDDILVGHEGSDELHGGDGNDILDGGRGMDFLSGESGNDFLSGGGGGTDVLSGGDGNDIITYDRSVLSADGGAGFDILLLSEEPATYVVPPGADFGYLVPGKQVTVRLSAVNQVEEWSSVTGFEGADFSRLSAYAGSVFAYGNDEDNLFIGTPSGDTFEGGSGNDTLDGRSGADSMSGGAGNDTYIVDNIGDRVYETTTPTSGVDSGGVDTVLSSVTMSLDAYDAIRFVENLTLIGASNINGTGNALANVLTGNDGSNMLNGGLGNDTMLGGAGNDFYVVDVAGDQVFETTTTASLNDAGGIDTVQSAVSFNLDASAGVRFVERLTLTGTANINGTGNALANILTGNAGNNVLNGGEGADNLYGGFGADVHEGGANLAGTFDYARYDDANYGNLVINLANSALNTGAAAGDTYIGIEGLVGGVGNDRITSDGIANALWGMEGNDFIFGGGGADYMNGGNGADNLYGGAGADRHIGGSNLAGTYDYARYDDANHGNLVINLANATLNTGAAAGDTYSGIEGLVGGVGNDRITGDTGANRLWGFGGADSIFGGLGNDTLYGGVGVDRFYFDTTLNAATNRDTIADFSVVDDFLMLDDAVFAAIGATGFLTAARFATVAVGGNATTIAHRIVYEQSTGKLFHDADGSGAGVKVQFAQLTAGTALTAGDIWVY